MFKKTAIVLSLFVFFATGCKKEEVSKKKQEDVVLSKKYAKFGLYLYSDKNISKSIKGSYVARGEVVNLLAEEEGQKKVKGKITTFPVSKIRLSDDTTGYVKSSTIVSKIIIVTEANTKLYRRNNTSSGVRGIVQPGTIGFVVDEKANWLKADFTPLNAKSEDRIWKKWITTGYTDSADVMQDAFLLDDTMRKLTKDDAMIMEKKEGLKKDAREDLVDTLKAVSEKLGFIGEIAKKELKKYSDDDEEGHQPADYPGPDGAEEGEDDYDDGSQPQQPNGNLQNNEDEDDSEEQLQPAAG